MVLNAGREYVADDPPYSRLFVIFNRQDPPTEEEIREEFSAFGIIQDIFVVKDRLSREPKGVAYVKFSKMSEAALAMEELNNKPINNHSGVYKVFIARNRGESKGSDQDNPGRYHRLFITVPKTSSENDIKQHFSKFGDVQTVKLLRYRETNESKGIGYLTFARIYEAAKAVEESENDLDYKAVIARPKEKYPAPEIGVQSTIPRSTQNDTSATADCFNATVSGKLSKNQIFRLFDIAPGLRNIQIMSENGFRSEIVATYNSTLAAEYALNKLHGIEYPLGEFVSVESKIVNKSNIFSGNKRDYRGDQLSDYAIDSPSNSNEDVNQRLLALSKALTHATALLKSAGLTANELDDEQEGSPFCDFHLPPPKKVLPRYAFNEETGMRLFFVAHPSTPPLEALIDVYSRFGNFAGANILQDKNYGYLFFTSPESARKAIDATDEKIISGMTMNVLKAEPKGEQYNKRQRTER